MIQALVNNFLYTNKCVNDINNLNIITGKKS